jgi:signal peptidase II
MKIKRITKVLISLLIILSNISCDQITKDQARENISEKEVINVLDDNFILTKVENTGAALSLGENLNPTMKILVLQMLPILMLVFMFIYIIREPKVSKLNLIAFSFIIGGGIGNIYDRILYGSVTDFMYLEYESFHTGIFNMADVSVVVGSILMLINLLIIEFNNHQLKASL